MSRYYGVSQFHCGHEYRWIYSQAVVEAEVGEVVPGECVDILWPMGGSNSSATCIVEINNDKEALSFLKAEAGGPDLEDPTLVDIAEYLLTIETGDKSCTANFLDYYHINKSELTQYDDMYEHRFKSESMIAEMLQYEEKLSELKNYKTLDKENPFYGDSRDVRFSELCSMYDEFSSKVKDWEDEIDR